MRRLGTKAHLEEEGGINCDFNECPASRGGQMAYSRNVVVGHFDEEISAEAHLWEADKKGRCKGEEPGSGQSIRSLSEDIHLRCIPKGRLQCLLQSHLAPTDQI